MKRLVDETNDEFARALLVAGVEHRPPPGNKAQLIVALGAGSTLGLFSANAFAWLGTTAGKVTAAGVAVGVASAVFIAGPELLSSNAVSSNAVSSNAVSSNAVSSDGRVSSNGVASTAVRSDQASASAVGPSSERAASADDPGEALARERGAVGGRALDGQPLDDQALDDQALEDQAVALGADENIASASGKTATKKLASWREQRLAARRRAALRKAHGEAAGAVETASQPMPPSAAAGNASASVPGRAAHSSSRVSASGVSAGENGHDLFAAKSDLDSEVKLVDEMHLAARQNDRKALGRFLERYRATFPDGQLKKEVAEFAARLEAPAP